MTARRPLVYCPLLRYLPEPDYSRLQYMLWAIECVSEERAKELLRLVQEQEPFTHAMRRVLPKALKWVRIRRTTRETERFSIRG